MPIDYLDNKVHEVVIDVDGRRQRAHVEFFRGEIDSVQFPSHKDFYGGKIVSVVHVSETDPRLTNAAEIDRDEHGG